MADTVIIAGKQYELTDTVPWEIAITEGGFYFERARYLGLPEPPACFVADIQPTDETRKTIGNYHRQFMDAEAEQIPH